MSKNGTVFPYEERRTKSEFRQTTDIHHIIKRAQNGILPSVTSKKGFYADITTVPLNPMAQSELLEHIHQNWLKMPQSVRKIAQTPFGLFKWLGDSNNRDKAIEFGLIAKPESEPESKTEKIVPLPKSLIKRTITEEVLDDNNS